MKETQDTILRLLLNCGGKTALHDLKGIPYRKNVIQDLISAGKLVREHGFLALTESGRQYAEQLQQNTQQAKVERQEFVEKIITKFNEILAQHDGILSLAECHTISTSTERNIFKGYSKPIEVPSRALNSNERTWFFQGDEKEALRKIRRKVKAVVLERWRQFAQDLPINTNIKLDINLDNPKLSVSAIKKCLSLYMASINKISKDSGISVAVIERAKKYLKIPCVETPEGVTLLPISFFSENLDSVLGYYTVATKHIAAYQRVTRETVRRKIRNFKISPYATPSYASYLYLWKDVKPLFSDPVPDVREVINYFESQKQVIWEEEKRKQEEKIRNEHEKLLLLKDRLLAMFPVKSREFDIPKVIFHIGPTNSGKTHYALESFQKAQNGIYLAPLRLLAWEVFEKLNMDGYVCSLLTGEEVIINDDSRFFAATVEMMPEKFWDVVVLDECQMVTDEERGWAWTRVINTVRTREIHICCAPEAETLLKRFTSKLGYQNIETRRHDRLCPMEISQKPWSIENPEEGTIFVVFRRIDALALKSYFESQRIPTSVIYGALPPYVRRRQAERFINGETSICVATDAIGMGMNLPAKKVCFTTLEKFDGHEVRTLKPLEVRQIAGRAGRFGLQDTGEVGAIDNEILRKLRKLIGGPDNFPTRVRISPSILELEILEGSLVHRLCMWEDMNAIPEEYRNLIEPCNLKNRIRFAGQIPLAWQKKLGIEKCFTLVNAPVSEDSEQYWLECVGNIVAGKKLSPPKLPFVMNSLDTGAAELFFLESYIKKAEVYLWLGNREEFHGCVYSEDRDSAIHLKRDTSAQIDEILKKKITGQLKTCRQCGCTLPPLYTYALCEDCYLTGRPRYSSRDEYDFDSEDDDFDSDEDWR